ncbi:MAG: hypothetical protein Q4A98_03060 [Comamonadaceae bacterium]|nr:hypothetical protein [Comamonadaceae bacterium]
MHTTTHLSRLLVAAALAGLATSAQAQLKLECPAGAGLGDPATPLTTYTGADGVWEKRYGTTGTWDPAVTGNKHPAWYPGGGAAPANGSWLMPAPFPTPNAVPTDEPYYYRSPVITVDAQVNESSIKVEIQQATDNHYLATGIDNTNGESYIPHPQADSFGVLSAVFAPSLTWVTGANRLLLHTKNQETIYGPGAANPTGVYATFKITATCKARPAPAQAQAVPVDAPWALLLAGTTLTAFGARRLRKKR